MRLFKITVFILVLLLWHIVLLYPQDFIRIYSDFSEDFFGRSAERAETHGINLEEFRKFPSLDVANRDGLLTAVLVSSYVNSVLEELFSERQSVQYDTTIISISRESSAGTVYSLRDTKYGIDFSFSLEIPSDAIFRQIALVYGNNSYWYNVVSQIYRHSYVVRIFRAEDIEGYSRGTINYAEALYMATLIGERHQPLWGLHDGLAYLDNIGYALIRDDLADYSEYVNYRPLQANKDDYYRFIKRIESMGDDFILNLDALSRVIFSISGQSGPLQLPEALIKSEKGTQYDLAIFYYDILVREGYTCKLFLTEKPNVDETASLVVLFQDKKSYQWGIIGEEGAKENIHQVWERTFAIYFGQEVRYFELNADDVFSEKIISSPGEDFWSTSRM